MEPTPGQEMNPDFTSASETNAIPMVVEQVPVPPRYRKEENSSNVWLKSIMSLALYLIIGYYIFPSYKTKAIKIIKHKP